MPRHARHYLETSFFHVMVQGINKEYIFNKERYKNQYIQLLKKNTYEVEIKIIAFCIMDNHAHLLINSKDTTELSKYMHRVNSSYAKYYNYMEEERVGYVFRDRYKSQPILDRRQLIRCVKYIHNNPVKAGMVDKVKDFKYSSYNCFNKHKSNHSFFSKDEMQYICNGYIDFHDSFIDIDINIEDTINDGIRDFLTKENRKIFEIFENRDILKKLIKYLKFNKKVKYVEIRKKFEITRGIMDGLK